jgi:hypothetical protein
MAVVPRVLLDQVEQDPSQAGSPTVGPGAPGRPLQAAVGQRVGDQEAGAGHGGLPERHELLGVSPAAGCQSQSGSASQSTVSHGGAGSRPCSIWENQ